MCPWHANTATMEGNGVCGGVGGGGDKGKRDKVRVVRKALTQHFFLRVRGTRRKISFVVSRTWQHSIN